MSESFKAVIEDIANRAENAHDLAMDNPDSTTHCDAISAMLTDFVRRLVSAYDSDMDALLVSKNAEIDTLKDQVAQLAEMQNADIQCAKMIELEKSLGAQKAINHELVEALRMFVELCESYGCDKKCEDCGCAEQQCILKARAALAKASGEEVAK